MRRKSITLTATGPSQWIPLDYRQAPFNVSVSAEILSGSATYTVEHTFDDVLGTTGPFVAFPHTTLNAQTANKDGNYAFPVTAVRINLTAGASPNVQFNVIQGVR
jgi:hypothetical protein